MERKALFGGTFDPIHNGHIHVAYEALYNLNLDKVIFMPSGNPPHKNCNDITDADIRYKMVEEAIKGEKCFEVSDYEVKNKNCSYTYKTLEKLNLGKKNVLWYFIVGVDCLMDLDNWKNPSRVLQLCNFVVFNRPGYTKEEIYKQKNNIEKKYNTKVFFLDIPLLEISSTDIRKKIKQNENISYLVPYNVYKFINKHNLYY
ncbi:nicotinate-nucleotide adenylyltransferase [Clostridium acetireducens DSM 10703]|jgi:nicotinate-nucleotide adenylyltransferase|uniref:Probable nicotinate-nucleotide adenylyltransferase n=1 Tax=Clostridium acetireducens DSM 10703 TaxID=1121290 RepID=A0A1E8F1A7_9CLOT|nr:nicotinate-nucleotide adenylyltransferase [Clostridium acetireducens]OFI07210.1 nicotinate-nucleotide adenylyltransferase [Clostridium acetireducens DSM 10703]